VRRESTQRSQSERSYTCLATTQLTDVRRQRSRPAQSQHIVDPGRGRDEAPLLPQLLQIPATQRAVYRCRTPAFCQFTAGGRSTPQCAQIRCRFGKAPLARRGSQRDELAWSVRPQDAHVASGARSSRHRCQVTCPSPATDRCHLVAEPQRRWAGLERRCSKSRTATSRGGDDLRGRPHR